MRSEPISPAEIQFITRCASIAAGVSIKNMNRRTRVFEVVIARSLVYYYFRHKMKGHNCVHSLQTVSKIFNQNHATVLNSVRLINNLIDISDKDVIRMKSKFDESLKFMKQLLEEAELRQKERDESDAERKKEAKVLKTYQRNYRKVVSKLIRTVERPPTQRDFDLLDHILNH